jgi:tetratricopeptide (TPR) repeat protein
MRTTRAAAALLAGAVLAAAGARAADAPLRSFILTTKSEPAKQQLRQLQNRLESFQGGAPAAEVARGIVALDPDFALGTYFLSVTTPGPEGRKHLQHAVELAKNASDGERRYIEAMALARGKTPADAVEPLKKLAADYPGERVVLMSLGQTLAGLGRTDEARAAYEQAIKVSGDTPRAYALLGNASLLAGNYTKARELYAEARAHTPKGTAAGAVAYGTAYTYLYESKPDDALKVLTAYVDEYKNATVRTGDLPEVFIWNSIARINLENGRLEAAMKAYEKGFESVPASKLSEEDKKIWLGRLHHGKGRTLARMGKREEAWTEAEAVRQMIAEGGERGKEFEPSYHYIAGYLKLEAGDAAAAIEHLKQSEVEDDPFRMLLLARAYEKAGKKDEARKLYTDIVNFPQSNMERALAYPEAKKRLAAL